MTPERESLGVRERLRRFRGGQGRPVGRHPQFVAWLVTVLLLGMWGTFAGPGWNPQPMTSVIVPETSNTQIVTATETPTLGRYTFTVEVVQVGDIEVTVRRPVMKGASPGVVVLHGTGTSSHDDLVEHGEWLASAGITTAIPDKPQDNYTAINRDYDELAAVYEEVATYLRGLDSVDPKMVGYLGESEGALIAPMSAVADPATAFLILVSDPVLPIRDQGALAADSYLRNIGVPEQVLRAIPRLISSAVADGNFDYANFDPKKYHEQLRVPVLMAYGTADMSMPIIQGANEMGRAMGEARNDELLVRYYKDADHGLRVNKFILREPFQDMADFVNGLPSSVVLSPQVAGAQPRQNYVAPTVTGPRWFVPSHIVQMAFVAFIVTVLGSALAVAMRKRVDYEGVGRAAIYGGLSAIVAWAGFIGYLLVVAYHALAFEGNSLLISGGWLITQALALFAVWMVLRFARLWHNKRPLSRNAGLIMGAVFVGQVLLVFALAYWGLFPSII